MFDNPISLLDNPAGYGPGTYVGPKLTRSRWLLGIAFTWLSRSGGVPKKTREMSLGEYQALHVAALGVILRAGRYAAVQAGIDVTPNNYTLHKGHFYAWCKPCKKWLDTGVTPSALRGYVASASGAPEYQDIRRARAAEAAARAAHRAPRAHAAPTPRGQTSTRGLQSISRKTKAIVTNLYGRKAIRGIEFGRAESGAMVTSFPNVPHGNMRGLVCALDQMAHQYGYYATQASPGTITFFPLGSV